ncbi:MAG: hypothetical protein ACLFWF_04410 [Alphaproteobacteria bacterium]
MSSQSPETDLPADVLEAVHANRKILAIKLLRDQRGLDLREAKETVEAYMAGHPNLAAPRRLKVKTGLGSLIWAAFVLIAAYAAYRLFFSA